MCAKTTTTILWPSMAATVISMLVVSVMVTTAASRVISSEYNVIEAQDTSGKASKKYCILDYTDDKNVTQHQKRNQFLDLDFGHYDSNVCPQPGGQPPDINHYTDGKYVVIKYSTDCDINEQIDYFQKWAISGLFVSIGCSVDIGTSINITNDTLFDNKFSVSLISDTSVHSIQDHHFSRVKLFDVQPVDEGRYGFDYSIVCIWLLATFTVCLGAFWSGTVRLNIFHMNTQKTKTRSETEPKEASPKSGAEEEAFINLSPFLVLGFVLLMALMLLLLYYFFQYLVYVIIFLFTLASMASLFACLEPVVLYLCPQWLTRPAFILFSVRCGKMYYYQSVLLVLSIAVSVTWFVLRKEPYAWILQDLLGVCFSLNMLRTIRLPSYKICVILLSALFFYDIFFVFITPLITSRGNSVMVDVATGGSSGKSRCGTPGEQIPMVMRIPHKIFKSQNSTNPLDVCFASVDSLLGFGDILVPGLLVSYCYAFDLIFDIKYRIYYTSTCIGYGLGLIATFAGLYLMSGSAQPALLYLVPFTTIPPILISLYRKEFRKLWMGPEFHFLSGSQPAVTLCGNKASTADTNSIEDNNLLISGESQQSVPQNSQ